MSRKMNKKEMGALKSDLYLVPMFCELLPGCEVLVLMCKRCSNMHAVYLLKNGMYKIISAEKFETILRSGVVVDFVNIISDDDLLCHAYRE